MRTCNRFKLEGGLILKSSKGSYHMVFNRAARAVLKLKEDPAADYPGVEEILNVELTASGQEVHERILRGWQILAHYAKPVTMIKRRGATDVGELSVEVASHVHVARIEVTSLRLKVLLATLPRDSFTAPEIASAIGARRTATWNVIKCFEPLRLLSRNLELEEPVPYILEPLVEVLVDELEGVAPDAEGPRLTLGLSQRDTPLLYPLLQEIIKEIDSLIHEENDEC
jgi:hypothetical protein